MFVLRMKSGTLGPTGAYDGPPQMVWIDGCRRNNLWVASITTEKVAVWHLGARKGGLD
jgi:hypothetical protein